MVKLKRTQNSRRHKQMPNVPSKDAGPFDDETEEFGGHSMKKWHEDILEIPDDFKVLPESEVNQLREEARMVLENDSLHHKNKNSRGQNQSNYDWLHTMVTKGTFQDRIAASVLLIQNSPLHGLGIIKRLVSQVKNVKECTKVMGVLTDLFISDLLVPNKKLHSFERQPLSLLEKLGDSNLGKRNFYLKMWYFEDQLKNEYRKFIQGIIDVGRDTVESNRERSILALQKLLAANPEQEVLLLSSLVNKIGDPNRAVASKSTLSLGEVLKEHPNMKSVVMNEIEKLLFRRNISERAQYYSICFLSQYILSKDEEELANKLIEIYFSFFKACIKKGDVDAKIMSAVLVGVKRAFPFSNTDALKIKEHIETMYRMVHIARFNVSLHVLYLLLQVSEGDAAVSDRFYSVLYRKLLDPELSNSSLHAMFISLVFRALSKDIEYKRIKVFIKRLLQICHYVPVPVACGILIMISHLFKKNKKLECMALVKTEFNDKEEEESDGEHYEDVKLEEIEERKEDISDGGKLSPLKGEVTILTEESNEKKPIISSWYHVANLKTSLSHYKQKHNVNARNPLFVGSELCVYTELVSLATHFHPTVSLYANHLLQGTSIRYSGDPLKDFTLQNFLNRWVFKNPKNMAEKKIESKLSREGRNSSRVKTLAITSEEYLNTPVGLIPPEELFMFRHLKKKQEEKSAMEKIKGKDDDDDDEISSVASDEFDGMMNQLMSGKEVIDFSEGIQKLPSKTEKHKKKRGKLDSDSEDDDDDDDEDSDDDDEYEIDENEELDAEMGDEDDEMADEGNDDKIDYSDIKEEFSDLDDLDDEEEAITFEDDDEDDFAFTMSDIEEDELDRRQKNKKSNLESKNKKKKGIDSSVFAPVEKFAQMLEETGDQFAKYGNLANVSNKDKAGMKQLKWEMNRNEWIHGHNGKRKRPAGGKGGTRKPAKKFKQR